MYMKKVVQFFVAILNMPFYFKMVFAIDLFDKNTIFTVRKNN